MKKIFISYSRADGGDFAEHLSLHYENKRYPTFVDKDDIKGGEDWANRIKNSIADSDFVAVIITRSVLGIAERPSYVEKEVKEASAQKKRIIPCVYKGIPWGNLPWDLDKLQGIVFDNKESLVRQLDEIILENKSPVRPTPDYSRLSIIRKSKKLITVLIISAVVITVVFGVIKYYTPPNVARADVVPLNLYYSDTRGDNFLTATDEGARSAIEAGYKFAGIEGYVYPNQQPGGSLVPLKLYYSGTRGDNFLTATDEGARSAIKTGYEFVRIEGYVYPNQLRYGNLVPLKLYYSGSREDYFTTATEKGISGAEAAGYELVGTEGYVYPNYYSFQ